MEYLGWVKSYVLEEYVVGVISEKKETQNDYICSTRKNFIVGTVTFQKYKNQLHYPYSLPIKNY
jgi:hypothetical protein